MTVEVAVMNKLGIALAADSAVTISQANGELKVYNTVNKLFSLSKYQPIGVMVYGSAELMGVPWETIVKTYRARLGHKKFDTVQGYAEDLVNFFEGNSELFPESQQHAYFFERVRIRFLKIRQEIRKAVEQRTKDSGKVSSVEIEQIVNGIVEDQFSSLHKSERLPSFPESFEAEMFESYGATVDEALNAVFEKLTIPEQSRGKLRQIAVSSFCRNDFDDQNSGVVIAGFGEKEIFPAIRVYCLEGIFGNKLKFILRTSTEISFEVPAYIVPFAQTDMVYTFMEGVDPKMKDSHGVPLESF